MAVKKRAEKQVEPELTTGLEGSISAVVGFAITVGDQRVAAKKALDDLHQQLTDRAKLLRKQEEAIIRGYTRLGIGMPPDRIFPEPEEPDYGEDEND